MATKLKKMKLTSVDLVRAGANQEADICLYKSADPQEATEGPTEDEKNIFKRFLAFIRGTPAEAENEPHSPVEKAEEPADIESIYKSALVDSIHSIYTDDNLTDIEKKAMAEQSIGQFQERMKEALRDDDDWDDDWDDDDPDDWNDDWDDDHDDDPEDDRYDDIEEIEAPVHKYNHNHGADGRFTTSGGGGAAPAAGGSFWSKVDSGTLDLAIKEPGRGAIAQIMRSDLPEDAASPHVTYDVKDVSNIDDQGYGDVKLDYRLGYYVKRDAPINNGQTFNDVYRHEYADVKTKTIRLKVNGGGQGDTKYDKPYHNQAKRLAESVGGKKMSGEIPAKKVKEAIGRGGTVKEFAGKAYMISPQSNGGITCYTGTKGARGKFNIERYTSGLRTLEDAQMWGVGTILNNN